MELDWPHAHLSGTITGMERKNPKDLITFLADSFGHLLWPAVCINCRSRIADNNDKLCNNCWGELLACTTDFYCRRCGRDTVYAGIVNDKCPACAEQNFHFDSIIRCGTYSGTLRNMILVFKNSHCELAPILGRIAETALHNSPFGDNIDYLVPVPLHWKKRLARGYNQSLLIAKKLCSNGRKLNTDLVRIRNTAPQTNMNTDAQRVQNIADAFAIRKGHEFTSKTICLIDDIKTTGATLNECAKTLKDAGAGKVYALVLAVAGQNSP